MIGFLLAVMFLLWMVSFFLRAALWLLVFVTAFLAYTMCHAAESGLTGWMANKAGGAVVLTERHDHFCRGARRVAFTTNAQNQIIRRGCWRVDGSFVSMSFQGSPDVPGSAWPVSWFTFDKVE